MTTDDRQADELAEGRFKADFDKLFGGAPDLKKQQALDDRASRTIRDLERALERMVAPVREARRADLVRLTTENGRMRAAVEKVKTAVGLMQDAVAHVNKTRAALEKGQGAKFGLGAINFASVARGLDDALKALADCGVSKSAAVPFRALAPLDVDRDALKPALVGMTTAWRGVFTKQRRRAIGAAAILREVKKTADDDESRSETIIEVVLAALGLDLTRDQMNDMVATFSEAAHDAGARSYAQIAGVSLGDASAGDAPSAEVLGDGIFDQLNARAIEWAKEHAAELVSDVNAVTREAVRRAVAGGLADGQSYNEIIDAIGNLTVFGDARAALIGETEIANANSEGALQGLFQARAAGVDVKKAWLTAGGLERICEPCRANEVAGPIDLDDAFPSGDMAPTAHPNCRCALIPYVGEGAAKAAPSWPAHPFSTLH